MNDIEDMTEEEKKALDAYINRCSRAGIMEAIGRLPEEKQEVYRRRIGSRNYDPYLQEACKRTTVPLD